jgi:hypothetical protein
MGVGGNFVPRACLRFAPTARFSRSEQEAGKENQGKDPPFPPSARSGRRSLAINKIALATGLAAASWALK